MKEGETRAEGTLEEVACRPDGIVIRVKSGERMLRVSAKRLDDVEFITHRDDLRGSVARVPRPPPTDGEAVAVEFLSKRTAH